MYREKTSSCQSMGLISYMSTSPWSPSSASPRPRSLIFTPMCNGAYKEYLLRLRHGPFTSCRAELSHVHTHAHTKLRSTKRDPDMFHGESRRGVELSDGKSQHGPLARWRSSCKKALNGRWAGLLVHRRLSHILVGTSLLQYPQKADYHL